MAWSIRELAELAGTTLETVRRYHAVGLLEEPDRLPDGVEQYGVPHLLRVLQVERLVELGLPLAEVASAGRAEQDPHDELRLLGADLAAGIDRLERVRAELRVVLRHRALVDLPAATDATEDDLTEVDRGLLTVYAHVLDDADEFERLPPDADGATRGRLAAAVAAAAAQLHDGGLVSDPDGRTGRPVDVGGSRVMDALQELYNPAQVDVLVRAYALTRSGRHPGPPA